MTDPSAVFAAPGLRHLIRLRGHPILRRQGLDSLGWGGPGLSIAVLSDLHVVAPWVSLDAVSRIATMVSALRPDLIVLAGDYLAGRSLPGARASAVEVVAALAPLQAPLGVFAVLGNHDWHDCPIARDSGNRENSVANALRASSFHLLQNANRPLQHQGHPFWIVGLDSQRPFSDNRSIVFHQPDLAYDGVPPGANSILIAHEPDYFAEGDARSVLQISGHTHGGQLNLFGWRPLTPSAYGGRFAYGPHRDGGRQMLVSAGIGFSGLPVRIAQPPEVNLITLRRA